MSTEVATTDNRFERIVELIQQGISAWAEAGRLIAEGIDENKNFIDELCSKHPMLSDGIVRRFEQIGRGTIDARLLVTENPGAVRLRQLPIQLQQKHLSEPVEVLIKTDSGWETLRMDVMNLTRDQAAQVFTADGVRSVAAQRAFIEDRAMKQAAPLAAAELPYRVNGRKLVITNPCTLTSKDLARVLAEME